MKSRTGNRVGIVIATLFLFLGFFFSRAMADDLAQGKKLFEGKCARCHGKDAMGNAKMAPNLKVDVSKLNLRREEVVHKSIYEIETMVDSGDHKMPKYRGKLTDTQIHQVALYLKQLTGNAGAKDEATTAK